MIENVLSALYRMIRSSAVKKIFAEQVAAGKYPDLEEVVERYEPLLKRLPGFLREFRIPDGIDVKLYDLLFPSPLTLASFKDDIKIIEVWLGFGLGGACIKTVMEKPRDGNKRPRLLEKMVSVDGQHYPSLYNAMGLPGKGVDAKVDELKQSFIFNHNKPIGISIGGSSMEEYKHNFDVLNNYLRFDCQFYFELNISCPNTQDGQQISKNSCLLVELLGYIRRKSNVVVGVKLSPDFSDDKILELVDLIKPFERTFVNSGNTKFAMREEFGLSSEEFSQQGGGLSGPALYPRTLELVKLIRRNSDIPIIATGGVHSYNTVRELLDYGANLVGMANAVVIDPYCIPEINKKLARAS